MPTSTPTASTRTASTPIRGTLSRRTTLLVAVALGTTACTNYSLGEAHQGAGNQDDPSPTGEPGADPDVPLAASVLAAEQALLARVEATIDAHPRLAEVLASTHAAHAAHVDLLADAVPEDSPSSSPTPAGSPTPRIPRDATRALRELARHEDDLSLQGKQAAFAAESGAFARVLACMAAAAMQQSAALRTARVPEGRR